MKKIFRNDKPVSSWQEAEKILPDNKTELGIHFTERGTVIFKLWSPAAFSVKIQFYKDWKSNSPDMTQTCIYDRKSGVWSYEYEYGSQIDGCFYEYVIDTGNGEKVCLDPYAVSMAAFCNDGKPGRAAVVDIHSDKTMPDQYCGSCVESCRAGASHAEGGQNTENFALYAGSKKKGVCTGADAIVYEVSVRDATINPDGSGGTYDAFQKRLDYLAWLGVTHIQLMPVLKFYNTDETKKSYEADGRTKNNNYNWGYDPHCWFTPEGWYSAEPENPYRRVKELRSLISAAHKKGLRIIFDVVYNHVSRTSLLDDIVPGYYFRLDKKGHFLNGSCCGNDTASEHAMMRRLIIDSAVFWVKEYGVDGFRFDLMGLIDSGTMLCCYEACKKVKDDILFIGEGWQLYTGEAGTVGMDQNYMTKTDDIAVFNDEFRDLCKGGGFNERMPAFLNGGDMDSKKIEQLFYNCTGRPQTNYKADNPADSVLYIACHDGLTLHDSIVLNTGADESTEEGRQEVLRRLKLSNALLLTSQGIAFIHAGQELGRTKVISSKEAGLPETEEYFVRNSYQSSDSINRIHWQPENDAEKMYSSLIAYTQGLIALRRAFPVFRLKTMREIEHVTRFIPTPEHPQVLFYSLDDGNFIWYLAFNASKNDVTLTLPHAQAEPSAQTGKTTQTEQPVQTELAAKSRQIAEVFVDADKASNVPLRTESLTDGKLFVPALSAKVVRIHSSC
ncbi:MAG: pullulanase [Treponemataceae bacterium]|nr:pullulanase [Treponemataceae bacterium]